MNHHLPFVGGPSFDLLLESCGFLDGGKVLLLTKDDFITDVVLVFETWVVVLVVS